MSQGFELEPLHVPQQSRRDKLRETPSLQMGCSGLFPIYDPSLISSSLQTCAPTENPPLKEAAMNSMGFVGSGFFPSSSSSSSSSSQLLLDLPQSSIALNQTFSQEDINSASNPLFYSSHIPQNPRDFDPSFHNGSGLVFKNHHHQPPQQPLSYAPHHDILSTGQGLSLSLSSHYRNRSDSAVFDGKGAGYYAVRGVSGGNPMVRSSVPMGPFTGYAAILKGSKFLKPAQQLLDELCDVGRGFYMDKSCAEPLGEPEMESLSENSVVEDCPIGSSSGGERRRINAKLISMLNEVYRRYKQSYQQLQAVIKSFESVAGLSIAAPFVSLAIKAMSKNFRCLKDAISNQLRSTSKVSEESLGKEENPNFRLVKVPHNLRILEQPHVWRPQRGLPERAVAVLRAWLFEHFLHPYPTDVDKQMLAKQTGLSRNQVSNWFINARVRLWKPMVEEMHVLDMREAEKVSEGESINANGQCKRPIAPFLSMDKWPQNTTTLKNQDPPLSPCRNELPQLPNNCNGSVNFTYDSVVNHHGVGASLEGRNGGISLTLGLHQNNGAGLPKSLPLAVPHFVFEESNNSYLIGPFESQNRREISGQLLHDFVG